MRYRVAINGYGRIGQAVLRAIYCHAREDFEVVAINELADAETVTYLTRYDTTHGRFPLPVELQGERLLIDGEAIQLLNQSQPEALPWGELGVDLLFECSGTFDDRANAERHLQSGAARLLFSQPAEAEATIVYGFNQQQLHGGLRVVSNASCTTNCVVPVLDLLDRHYGIRRGLTTTIHSAMNDQPVIDSYHHTNLRLTRSAMNSIVPVTTGLAEGIAKFLPHLGEQFECLHLRVPTINVSAMDLAIQLHQPVDGAQVNALFAEAAAGPLRGLLDYSEEPHASVDFNTDPHSAILDATQTRVSDGHLLKLLCWFDNEWGYANRMVDVARHWLRPPASASLQQ